MYLRMHVYDAWLGNQWWLTSFASLACHISYVHSNIVRWTDVEYLVKNGGVKFVLGLGLLYSLVT